MRKTKKILAFLMAVITIVASGTFTASARNFVVIDADTSAVVVEIIDVNAIIVRLPNGDEALVRLIGIADNGSDTAIRFLTNEIMGTTVFLARDHLVPRVGRWNYMYVSRQGRSINALLLVSGHARINEDHRNANQFSSFVTNQTAAIAGGLGIWTQGAVNVIIPTTASININTAGASQMTQNLDISTQLANAIISHRNQTVFQHINDLKFV